MGDKAGLTALGNSYGGQQLFVYYERILDGIELKSPEQTSVQSTASAQL